MNVEQVIEELLEMPFHLEVCTGRAGSFTEEIDQESMRLPVPKREGTGETGLTVVVIR